MPDRESPARPRADHAPGEPGSRRARSPIEARYPCPVCLGATLEKVPVDSAGTLVLDHCRRCGGVWFEEGEVVRLRSIPPAALWAAIAPAEELLPPRCHACHTHVDRRDPVCAACGEAQRLECPVCRQGLRAVDHEGLRLDACDACRGIWFDHHELRAVWRLKLGAALERRGASGRGGRATGTVGEAAAGLGEAALWAPDLALYAALRGAEGAAHVAAAGLPAAAEVAGGAVEAAGEAAAGAFEVIVEIIAGFFG